MFGVSTSEDPARREPVRDALHHRLRVVHVLDHVEHGRQIDRPLPDRLAVLDALAQPDVSLRIEPLDDLWVKLQPIVAVLGHAGLLRESQVTTIAAADINEGPGLTPQGSEKPGELACIQPVLGLQREWAHLLGVVVRVVVGRIDRPERPDRRGAGSAKCASRPRSARISTGCGRSAARNRSPPRAAQTVRTRRPGLRPGLHPSQSWARHRPRTPPEAESSRATARRELVRWYQWLARLLRIAAEQCRFPSRGPRA